MTNTVLNVCVYRFYVNSGGFFLTSFLPPEVFLACSIKAFNCCMLLKSVLASSSKYNQVFFWASLTTGADPPTGPTSRLDTSPFEGDATPVILA